MARKGFAHIRYRNAEDLGNAYLAAFPQPPYTLSTYQNNDANKFSFGLQQFVYFYVDMWYLTQDNAWIGLACDTCDYMISKCDSQRVLDGEITITALNNPSLATDYYQAPYPYQINGTPVPGWSSQDGSGGKQRVQILSDGQIIGAMAVLADCILDHSQDLSAYTAKANTYMAKVAQVLESHNNSWVYNKVSAQPDMTVPGSYYYPAMDGGNYTYTYILAFNHSCGALQAGLLYDKHVGNAEYVNKAEAFMTFMRTDLARQEVGERYFWPYVIENPAVSEDLNHGAYEFQLFKVAYDNNYLNISVDELTRYAKSAVNAWLDNGLVGQAAERFDGTGLLPDAETFDPSQYVWLSAFEPDLFKMCRDLVGTYHLDLYANVYSAYSRILRYKPDGIIY